MVHNSGNLSSRENFVILILVICGASRFIMAARGKKTTFGVVQLANVIINKP